MIFSSNGDESKRSTKGQIFDLLNMPDDIVFSPGAVQITNVDVPVRLPDGTVCGKARVVEGDSDETTMLVEIESNSLIASLFKSRLLEVSIVEKDQTTLQDTFIELD